MSHHCSLITYLLQVKKCLDPTCYYYLKYPVQMTKVEFQKLSFIPLSLIVEGKYIIVSSKLWYIPTCQDCLKPRHVYAKSKLKFICGSCIFPLDSPFSNVICVREKLSCVDPIELSYFSTMLVHFPPLCYWCGLSEEALVRDQEFTNLARNYQTVYVICMFCKQEGNYSQEIFCMHLSVET